MSPEQVERQQALERRGWAFPASPPEAAVAKARRRLAHLQLQRQRNGEPFLARYALLAEATGLAIGPMNRFLENRAVTAEQAEKLQAWLDSMPD